MSSQIKVVASMNCGRRAIYILFAACFIGPAAAAPKEPITIKDGFLSGNSFRELSHGAKRSYVVGFVDGVLIAPMFDAPKGELRWFERCVTGMGDEQLLAVVNTWLSENPVRWHQSMHILAFVALKQSCTTK